MLDKENVVCIHVGARAHYLFPIALEKQNRLKNLITDTWISSQFFRKICRKIQVRILKSFSNRYSDYIPSFKVISFSISFLLIELLIRISYRDGWPRIIAQNNYFQKIAAQKYKQLSKHEFVLGISYTSLNIFEIAKQQGKKTILFQIDPGFEEEIIVDEIVQSTKTIFKTTWQKAPPVYWQSWRKECALSDLIIVNSEWSKTCLLKQGINDKKIEVLSLPVKLQAKHLQFKKTYPENFSKERPMRCLFLGTLTIRKGIHLIIETALMLKNFYIEFLLVGKNEIDQRCFNHLSNVIYKGVVSRSETDFCYKQADLFLFPTFSDGFGLTQLEAMCWKLPVIATNYCGKIVENGYNGFLINECTATELSALLISCIQNTAELKRLSLNCLKTAKKNSVENFSENLNQLL